MSTSRKADQTIALAGVFQAADAVQRIAHTGQCPESLLETCIRSLFHTNPANAVEVYGELHGVRTGLDTLSRVMIRQTAPKDIEILRYGLNLLHLERHLSKQPDMLDVIASRLDQARNGVEHFGYTHSNVIRNLAAIYTDTISTFRIRINVSGEPRILQMEENAAKVRAVVLAGIRSAVLWRQLGGRRWQLIFGRGSTVAQARELLQRC